MDKKFKIWSQQTNEMLDVAAMWQQQNCEWLCAFIHTPGKIQVASKDLLQSTGLMDVNGYLIYNGDIIKCFPSNIIGHVVYDEKMAYWLIRIILDNESAEMSVHSTQNEKGWNIRREIIGNIYSNPELLK